MRICEFGPLAEGKRFSRGPSSEFLSNTHGDCYRDVLLESDPFTALIETVRQYPSLDTEVSDAFTKRSCDITIRTIGRCCDERYGG